MDPLPPKCIVTFHVTFNYPLKNKGDCIRGCYFIGLINQYFDEFNTSIYFSTKRNIVGIDDRPNDVYLGTVLLTFLYFW